VVADEFQSPGKRPHNPVIVFLGVRDFPRPHPLSEQCHPPKTSNRHRKGRLILNQGNDDCKVTIPQNAKNMLLTNKLNQPL
jgi:hypothetical protein